MRFVMNVGAMLAAGVALGGCSLLLDFDEAGLACDAEGQCLQGYVCTAENVCMPENHASTLCEPECGALQTCVKSKCVPVCDERACAAGQSCVDGECIDNPPVGKLGSPCESDAVCGAVTGDVCLKPYGGGIGVCTRACDNDGRCDARAPKCVQFDNGQETPRGLCANESFKPCSSEATCASSSLSCGVYALKIGDAVVEPISACRQRLTGNEVKAIGESCSPASPCANGLCVQTENGRYNCTAPCQENPQCNDLLGGTGHACLPVTLNPEPKSPANTALPAVRPRLCVQGGASREAPCAGGCRADAPFCGDSQLCVTACGEGNNGCPVGTSCQPQTSGSGPDVCLPAGT